MEPWQGDVFPVIIPGCAGTAVTVTVVDRAAPVPQVLLAVTVIVPPVEPAVAVMVFVVEVPDQPDGRDQV